MIKRAENFLDRLDRLLPMVALSLALFLQGLIASGAAATMVVPGLQAPDGSTLTLADICNNTDDGTSAHCHACTHAPLGVLASEPTIPALTCFPAGSSLTRYTPPALFRPEAHSHFRTGPPTV
ncbi:MAG: hypothetical protein HWE25_10320 [Alphaproteobacteria bacterium]|nr:hypothetical protein [Alphaproteobacteria bacterium]